MKILVKIREFLGIKSEAESARLIMLESVGLDIPVRLFTDDGFLKPLEYSRWQLEKIMKEKS